ncbi:BTB/POZ and MATH domain-containing protein 1-like [Lolium perenne]|uniref:BTB/POZ and MATH domain-containing protein 1-like n=1 Tax=Lolium perenne TaxID=4522 RepID=UPI0021F6756F|nr:BTB/POZ and MATH domain-containing protein 1-like [Lolium perenne]
MDKVEGFHRFEVRNYSLIKGISAAKWVRSGTFPVGGYDWSVVFYPSGCLYAPRAGNMSLYLELMTSGATARAAFVARFVNPATGRSRRIQHSGIGQYNTTGTAHAREGISPMTTAALEATYVDRDSDRLVIEVTLTVMGEPRTSAATRLGVPAPPSSDLPAHLGRLLESGELADVTFQVRGERFAAHRMVLAMRSPVFKAELFGPMSESGCITIQDVDPAVFKLLLDVIYTDAFPAAMHDLDEDSSRELARHLLAAADRYGMDRLKAQCANILSTSLNAHTVSSTLALAHLHGCHQLKDACVGFIITLGMDNGSVLTSREDHPHDQQLGCFTFLGCFCKAVASILRIH